MLVSFKILVRAFSNLLRFKNNSSDKLFWNRVSNSFCSWSLNFKNAFSILNFSKRSLLIAKLSLNGLSTLISR